ncbi:cobalamin biosynthesis protein, partial [Peribacillus sp. NPDC060186]
ERNWWTYETALPEQIIVYPSIEDALQAKPLAALVVTHRELSKTENKILENGIVFRPKVIALGIGCNRGTSAIEIEQVIVETLAELSFSIKSVKAICTISIKKDEIGLLEVVQKYGWQFVYFEPEELNQAKIEAPSDTVYKYTGAYGVSEPAVRIFTGAEQLELVKKKSGNVTISVGIIPF